MSLKLHQVKNLSNKEYDWFPMDTEGLYNEHMEQEPTELARTGYDRTNIKYTFNSDGFRSPEFEEGGIMFIGCSETLGVGRAWEDQWTTLIANSLNLAQCNLGIIGASADTVFRNAYDWIPKLKPKIVHVLVPSEDRFELLTDKDVMRPAAVWMDWVEQPDWKDYEVFRDYWKLWYFEENNSKYNQLKNVLAVKQIAETYGAHFSHTWWDRDWLGLYTDLGRDLHHFGKETSRNYAKILLETNLKNFQVNENNS